METILVYKDNLNNWIKEKPVKVLDKKLNEETWIYEVIYELD